MIGETIINLRENMRPLIRYSASGVATIICYGGVLVLLVEVARLGAGLAAGIAMLLAGTLNYIMVKQVVFRSRRQHQNAAPRYIAVLAANTGVNTVVTWLACDFGGLPYGPVQVLYVSIATIAIFLAMKKWVMTGRTLRGDRLDPG